LILISKLKVSRQTEKNENNDWWDGIKEDVKTFSLSHEDADLEVLGTCICNSLLS